MIPTKVRDLITPAAAHVGIPEEHLANIMSYYFKENKKHLSNLDHLHIILRGLGTMNIKGWELEKRIFDFQQTIQASRVKQNIEAVERQIVLYRKANTKWLDEMMQKQKVRELKNQYYANKNISNESQGKDTVGLEE